VVAQRDDLVVGELVDADVAGESSGLEGLGSAGLPDAEDVGERDLQTLLAWEVNADQTCHEAGASLKSVLAPESVRSWTAKVSDVTRSPSGASAFDQG
jgi:hypothetical protein